MSRLALLVCTLAALALAGCVSLFPRSYDAAVDATVPGLVYGDAPPTPGVSTCKTSAGQCRINAYAAAGSSCWCATRHGGAATGVVIFP